MTPETSTEPLEYEPCPVEEHVGGFEVVLEDEYTSVGGKVFDAVDPLTAVIEVAAEAECRVVREPQFNCEPECGPTEVCGADSTCVLPPMGRDVGTVTVQGLVRPVQMTPGTNTKNYSAAPALPHPGFETGANITLSATGGDYEPFTLRGWGVSLFALTNDDLLVEPGVARSLTWDVPAESGPTRVLVTLEINVHGATKAWIECDVPDTGSAEIPASLIDTLFGYGLTGNPTLTATRRTASSASIEPGCVELLVFSGVAPDVTIPGLISCNSATPCPEGLTCVTPEQFCE